MLNRAGSIATASGRHPGRGLGQDPRTHGFQQRKAPLDVAAAVADIRKLLPDDASKPSPRLSDEPCILAEALAQIVLRPDRTTTAKEVDLVLGFVRSVRERFTMLAPRLAAPLGRLWAARIAMYAQAGEPPPPTRAEFAMFESEWGGLSDADKNGLPIDYVHAWRCECLLMCNLNDAGDREQALLIANGLPTTSDVPYVRYVRALGLRAVKAEWEAMLEDLSCLFTPPPGAEGLPPELKASNRLSRAACWAITAAAEVRRKQPEESSSGCRFPIRPKRNSPPSFSRPSRSCASAARMRTNNSL